MKLHSYDRKSCNGVVPAILMQNLIPTLWRQRQMDPSESEGWPGLLSPHSSQGFTQRNKNPPAMIIIISIIMVL